MGDGCFLLLQWKSLGFSREQLNISGTQERGCHFPFRVEMTLLCLEIFSGGPVSAGGAVAHLPGCDEPVCYFHLNHQHRSNIRGKLLPWTSGGSLGTHPLAPTLENPAPRQLGGRPYWLCSPLSLWVTLEPPVTLCGQVRQAI